MFAEYVTHWYRALIEFLPQLLMIALIVALTSVLANRVKRWVAALAGRTQAPAEIADLLGRTARVGVLLVGGLLVLQQLGWQSAVLGFVTGLGVSGIIIGFALQDIVKQFAAGVLLLMLRPFRLGDTIRVTGFEGTVQGIQLRATVLKTVDGEEVLIPNADVYSNAVVNRSHYLLRRRAISLTLPNTLALAQVQAAITGALRAVPGVAQEPKPSVVATALAADTVTAEARFWIDSHADSDSVTTHAIDTVRQQIGQLIAEQGKGAKT